jgi:hypothetical protein
MKLRGLFVQVFESAAYMQVTLSKHGVCHPRSCDIRSSSRVRVELLFQVNKQR